MTIFTIEITDQSHLSGIYGAREAYNATLPATITVKELTGGMVEDPSTGEMIPEETIVVLPNPELLNTDEEYVQFVMSRAAESYAKQLGV